MLNFEQYKREQDEAEAAYEAELRKKKPHELTPEEIGYLADQNEAFEGKTLDKNAARRYEELAGMVALLLNSDSALQTLAFPPDKSDPNYSSLLCNCYATCWLVVCNKIAFILVDHLVDCI